MGLLKKVDKPKPLRTVGRGAGGSVSTARPQQNEKTAPCGSSCPAGNDVRAWLNAVSQATKLGMTADAAFDEAFRLVTAANPMPSVLGRVCPHPCEKGCNRTEKDGAVGINSLERFIGDWGLERKLALPIEAPRGSRSEKIAVIGSGPAGLACAYHMARRGYAVTIFESLPQAGGMLRYGIPDYRLPREVLDGEIQRIVDLGVELRVSCTVGKDVSLETIQKDYDAVFLAIGAHQGKKIRVPGEDGSDVYTGTEFLRLVAMGKPPVIGKRVAVIGGGDTAIDAARVSWRLDGEAAEVSKRLGSQVTIYYRRTRTEMPAIEEEVVGALEENVKIEFLAAPAKILRGPDGRVQKLVIQRMKLGEPDSSGRRAPVPIEGDTVEVECDTVITAVSQEPDFATVGGSLGSTRWLNGDAWGKTELDKIWTGGDNINLGLATTAIGQGRKAALSIHAALRGEILANTPPPPEIRPARLKLDFYAAQPRSERAKIEPAARLTQPHAEIDHGLSKEEAITEASRCFSCGFCFGCERCWMFCTPSCFTKASPQTLGHYYKVKLETCDGCNKCADECPCGYLDMV